MEADEETTGVADIYVQPGEVHLVRVPAILRTVLGSCVGVTFWNETAGDCGAVPSHAAAVSGKAGNRMSLVALRRYVDAAIREVGKTDGCAGRAPAGDRGEGLWRGGRAAGGASRRRGRRWAG